MSPPASPPLGRRDSRKHDKRSAIVSAAKDSFLKSGYSGMSMSGLIETLGGSKATLWRHFRSKEDLFAAVLEDAVGGYGRALAQRLLLSDDLRSALVVFCHDIVAKMLSDEGLALSRLITAEGGRFPEVGKLFYAQAAGPVEASLAAYLRRYMDSGAVIQDDPRRLARTLLDLCQGFQQRRLWGLELLNDEDIAIEASRIADVFLRAFGAPAPPR
jgi:AcrR family transcriptional regulator